MSKFNGGPVWLKIVPERQDKGAIFLSIQCGPLSFSGIIDDADLLALARLEEISLKANFYTMQPTKCIEDVKLYGNDSIMIDADTLGLPKVEK